MDSDSQEETWILCSAQKVNISGGDRVPVCEGLTNYTTMKRAERSADTPGELRWESMGVN